MARRHPRRRHKIDGGTRVARRTRELVAAYVEGLNHPTDALALEAVNRAAEPLPRAPWFFALTGPQQPQAPLSARSRELVTALKFGNVGGVGPRHRGTERVIIVYIRPPPGDAVILAGAPGEFERCAGTFIVNRVHFVEKIANDLVSGRIGPHASAMGCTHAL